MTKQKTLEKSKGVGFVLHALSGERVNGENPNWRLLGGTSCYGVGMTRISLPWIRLLIIAPHLLPPSQIVTF